MVNAQFKFNMANDTKEILVKVAFGNALLKKDAEIARYQISVAADGSDNIQTVKRLIAEAAGGSITADDILLTFGPNDRKLGRQYEADPTVDESKLLLKQYSILSWLERFPHWFLSARLLPPTPPPPGVAIQRAAAIAEQKDPEKAIQDARSKGEIPKINELPAPWGPKPVPQQSEDSLISSGYMPARYPDTSSPAVILG